MSRIKDSISYPKIITFVVGIWLVVFVLIPSYISPKVEIPPEGGIEEFRAGVPLPDEYKSICEMWRDKYPIIPNLSTPYTLRGEATMTLSPEEWSREIVFLNTMNFDVSDPLEFQLQSGETLIISPNQGLIDLRGERILKIRGKGCILFSFK